MVDWRWTGYNALIFLAAHAGDPARPVRGGGASTAPSRGGSSGRSPCRCCGRRSSSSSSSPPSAACSCSPSRCCSTRGSTDYQRRLAAPVPDLAMYLSRTRSTNVRLRLRLGGRLGAVPDHRDRRGAQLRRSYAGSAARTDHGPGGADAADAGAAGRAAPGGRGQPADLRRAGRSARRCRSSRSTSCSSSRPAPTTRSARLPPPLTPGRQPRRQHRPGARQRRRRTSCTGLINSALVVGQRSPSAVVFFSTLAGFAFAKLRFRGRNALLLVIVATMMVPTQLGSSRSTC